MMQCSYLFLMIKLKEKKQCDNVNHFVALFPETRIVCFIILRKKNFEVLPLILLKT